MNALFGAVVDPSAEPLRLELPAKVIPIVKFPRRYMVLHGGRGSAKSRTIARILVAKATGPRIIAGVEVPFRCLCTREIQNSMKDSVHRLIADEIQRLGLGQHFDVQKDKIVCPNGGLFLFAGLQGHTVESIKSFEGLTDVWVEEASSVCDHSWQILIPTLRGKGTHCYITFNPDLETDPVWQRFVVNPPRAHRIHRIELNFQDNPWFEDTELPEESEELLEKFPIIWQHVYGGQLRSINGLLFKREWLRYYDPDAEDELPTGMRYYLATDAAVTPEGGDWTVHVMFGMDHRGRLYLVDFWKGQTDAGTWIEAALDLVEKWRPLHWFEEKGPILAAVTGDINLRMLARQAADRRCFTLRVPLASIGSKANRALGINTRKPTLADQARVLGFAGRMQAGGVYFPTPSPERPWVTWLVDQLLAFHGLGNQIDDGTDACSILARGLDEMVAGTEADPPPPPPPPEFSEPWFAQRDAMAHDDAPDRDEFYNG